MSDANPGTTSEAGDPPVAQAQGRVLRVLVAYTQGVAAAVADVPGLVQLAIAETNESYRNSQIDLTAVLADMVQVTYTEAGHSTDLDRFRGDGDGSMDEVHARRHQFRADVAVLLVNDPEYCGLAWGILVQRQDAFATVHYTCATGYYSFAHEMGHLQGARHNPEADPGTTPHPYCHGYYYEPANWRTIMSYNCPSGCTRLPFWSNPNVLHNGVAMGTTQKHNNARCLNETAPIVTNFEGEPALGALGYALADQPTTGSYTPIAMYAYNSTGGPITVRRMYTGLYRVTFAGLGGRGTFGGHVQVTKHGVDLDKVCHVIGWSSGDADFSVDVWCFDTRKSGTPVDSRFTVYVTWP